LIANGVGNFTWSTGETGSIIRVNPTETTTYTVTAATSCAIDATDSVTIEVSQPIDLDVSEDVSICSGESITLTATSNSSVLWSNGSTNSSITVSPTITTSYTVSSSNENCSEEKTIRVTVNKSSDVVASDDLSICSGEVVVLTAVGEGDFLWSTGESGSSITVSPVSTSTYTVTSSSSCGNSVDEVIVTVKEDVVLDVDSDVSICQGDSIILSALGSGEDFLWSTGETTSSISVNPTETITYTVTSSLDGCSKTKTIKVTVNQSPTVDAGSDVFICSGVNVTLTATGTGDFLWNTGETTASINVSPLVTTKYTVSLSNPNGCDTSVSDEVQVIVNNKPTVDASDDVTIEIGTSETLTARGNGTFKWSNGEEGNSITVNPSFTTTYVVTSTNETGCTEEDEVLVTVIDTSFGDNGAVVASMEENISICLGRRVTLNALEGNSYLWSNGETTRSITVTPEETVVYSVKVTTGSGSLTESIIISVNEDCANTDISSLENEMVVYPNPTTGLINVELTGLISKSLSIISVYNLNGVIVYSKRIENSLKSNFLKEQINLSKFAKGVYFVRIVNDNGGHGRVETKKILIM